jgi:hypothetical protein
MKKISYLISGIILSVFFLFNAGGVSARNLAILGEIQSAGTVSISSSNGKWSPAMPTYPLIQNTGIKTESGSASVFLKDGSRFDLSGDTLASITGEESDYSVNLAKGTIAFSVMPLSSLSVSTPSASVSINNREDKILKVGHDHPGRILGIISATEKGTEVTSISGDIKVTSSSAGTKTVGAGESMLLGPADKYHIYKTQAVTTPPEESHGKKKGLLFLGGIFAGEGLVLMGLNEIVDDGSRIASPSGFK